jgi:hypothetical protein
VTQLSRPASGLDRPNPRPAGPRPAGRIVALTDRAAIELADRAMYVWKFAGARAGSPARLLSMFLSLRMISSEKSVNFSR